MNDKKESEKAAEEYANECFMQSYDYDEEDLENAFLAGHRRALAWVINIYCEQLANEENHQYAWENTMKYIKKELGDE